MPEITQCEECEHCGEEMAIDRYSCQECCEHEFDPEEGFHCLNCGKDGAEEMAGRAYDRAKDLWKYGH